LGFRALTLTEPHIDIAVDLLQALAKLLDLIGLVFDAAGQIAHLLLDPVHSNLNVNGGTPADLGARRCLAASATIDLPLQHAQVAFQSIEALLHRSVLPPRRRYRDYHREEQQQPTR